MLDHSVKVPSGANGLRTVDVWVCQSDNQAAVFCALYFMQSEKRSGQGKERRQRTVISKGWMGRREQKEKRKGGAQSEVFFWCG